MTHQLWRSIVNWCRGHGIILNRKEDVDRRHTTLTWSLVSWMQWRWQAGEKSKDWINSTLKWGTSVTERKSSNKANWIKDTFCFGQLHSEICQIYFRYFIQFFYMKKIFVAC